jgi:pimeloyl-ACP methyl ester carboxylesterase
VLLHSINATASSFEMKPIAEHLADATDRPLYAVDWLGFGRSNRSSRSYSPNVFARQLYDVLTDAIEGPADLVALSLGCEYAAWMGLQAAPQVRRLVLIAPTGLTLPRRPSGPKRLTLTAAAQSGLFELLYYRFLTPSSLRSFYKRQVFLDAVPEALVDYAAITAQAKGAHHAPRRFLAGSLSVEHVADQVYARLYRPTLLLTPSTPGPTIQSFDRLPAVLDSNPDLTHRTLPGGLMPHWERPEAFFTSVDAFLEPA